MAIGQSLGIEGDLSCRSQALMSAAVQRILDSQQMPGLDSGMRLFGEGLPAILSRLGQLERMTHRVVYNLQRQAVFDPMHRERQPNQRSRSRNIHGHMITTVADHLSLVAACHPETWVAPVHVAGIAIDERLALFPGPLSPRGLPTAWLCNDTDLVMAFCDLWEETQRQAIPIWDVPGVVRLSERQIDVAALLCTGAKDATIARLLGVSLRTITNDIGRLLDAFGASTRWEAGMVLGRACPPGIS